ncbi:MAG: NAD+ synthase [Chlamydiota bacterium]
MKILACQINPTVGDLKANANKIINLIKKYRSAYDLLVFPELSLSGYPPEDLLLMPEFLAEHQQQLQNIIPHVENTSVILGVFRSCGHHYNKPLHNSAALISDGQILGYHDKMLLPTYDVFDELRYFQPGKNISTWQIGSKKIAITICEDIWHHVHHRENYPTNPLEELQHQQPDLLINISASPFDIGKPLRRQNTAVRAATTLGCPTILCNQVGANDSLIFDGHSLYVSDKGEILQQAQGFQEDILALDLSQSYYPIYTQHSDLSNLYQALVLGVKDYFAKQNFQSACLGLSGGIDSAVVACIAVDALGAENVWSVMMPSRYSSQASIDDARQLIKTLQIKNLEIPIEAPFQSYLDLLTPHLKGREPDTTEENLQARIRGNILMALSNRYGHLILSTGNKSELALGYCTLYGDMTGGLAVIADIPKTTLYRLAHWINSKEEIIPDNIIVKPPSAELRPNQKDTDALPEYEVVDNILEGYIINHKTTKQIAQDYNLPLALVEDIIAKIHRNEYKRRQAPIGLRVTNKAFSKGRQFPIVQQWR